MHHLQSYLLQQTTLNILKSVNWFQRYGQSKGCKIIGSKEIICFVWLHTLKSVFASSDSFCLITSLSDLLSAFQRRLPSFSTLRRTQYQSIHIFDVFVLSMASKSSVGKRTDDNSAVAIRKVASPDANAGLSSSVEKKSPLKRTP